MMMHNMSIISSSLIHIFCSSFVLRGQDCMTICISMIYHIPKLYLMLTVSKFIPCISFELHTNVGLDFISIILQFIVRIQCLL